MGSTSNAVTNSAYPKKPDRPCKRVETSHLDWSSEGSSLHHVKGWTELCIACYDDNYKQVLYLLGRGSDPNLQNVHKLTPLFYAVFNWNLSIVEALRRHGADVSLAQGPSGEPIAEYAVKRYGQQGGNIHAVDYHEMLIALRANGPAPAQAMVHSVLSQLQVQHHMQFQHPVHYQCAPSPPKRRRTELFSAGGSEGARLSFSSSKKCRTRTASSPPSSTAIQQQREKEPPAVRRRRIAAPTGVIAVMAASEVPSAAGFSEGTPPVEETAFRRRRYSMTATTNTTAANMLVEKIDLTGIDASTLMDEQVDEVKAIATEDAETSLPMAVEDPYLDPL